MIQYEHRKAGGRIIMKLNVYEEMIDASLTSGNVPISSLTDQGFKPSELLVASIAGCTGLVFQSILKKQRIKTESITIETETIQNEKEANRI